MANDVKQSEVDAVALAIATVMHDRGALNHPNNIATWPMVQQQASAAILALDRVRAEQRDGLTCPGCNGTSKRAPGAKAG